MEDQETIDLEPITSPKKPRNGTKDQAGRTKKKVRVLNLACKDLTVNEISKAVDLDHSTVQRYLDEWRALLPTLDKVERWSRSKGTVLDAAQAELLKMLIQNVQENPKNNAFTISRALEVVHNMTRLERNQSTSNVAVATFTESDLSKFRAK